MVTSAEHQNENERIEAEAAEWVIRLGDVSVSADARADFERWRAADIRHNRAFQFASDTWQELSELRSDRVADMDTRVPVRHIGARSARAISRRSWMSGGRIAIVTICLACALGFASFWYGNPLTILAADFRTAPGEVRTVHLPDGSDVDLSSDSAIALSFNDRERRVTLLKGAAYFTAAPTAGDERRPFVVQGENGTATALGTQFAVDNSAGSVEVAVIEHQVRVELSGSDHSRQMEVVLAPGHSVTYSRSKGLGQVEATNVEQATAWRRGRLIFDEVPLSKVVEELNRYRRGRIVISSSALADRKVSGVFQTNDLDAALSTITRELDIRTISAAPLITVLY
jgi:transmembrane sensor